MSESPDFESHGFLPKTAVAVQAIAFDKNPSTNWKVTCQAKAGEALLMRPLLLHASSPATTPKHRRVLHLVYHSGQSIAETWHRTI